MKVSIFVNSLSGGGAERVACNLAGFLVGRGHKVDLLTVSNSGAAYGLDPGVNHVALEKGRRIRFAPLRRIGKLLRLREYIKKTDTDAYLVMLLPTIRSLLYFKKLIRVSVIIAERCDPASYPAPEQKFLVPCAQKADAVVFQTADAQAWYGKAAEGKSRVIPNAINPEFIKEPYTGERRKVIVAIGRLTDQKNFSLLLHAFAAVADKFPDYSLAIFGNGPSLAAHKALAESLGIGERTKFPGFVTDIGEKILDASLFVLSSDYEGMPNALMEAMALGLPCISTDCPAGGPRYLIQDGENGLLVPVGDRDALAAAMEKVLSDKELAQRLGGNARDICGRLSAEKIYGQWEEFIRHMVKTREYHED